MDKRSDYIYELPERLIAQQPVEPRDSSRLLVLHRKSGELRHSGFRDLPDFLYPGDMLVLNNTRVIPARLIGKRRTGGEVELLLLQQKHPGGKARQSATWECLVKPARRVKQGETIYFNEGRTATVTEEGKEGRRIVSFTPSEGFRDWIESSGKAPLPPYIRREPLPSDRERYQTVYAEHDGAVAAPTAGLHFTSNLFDRLEEKGVLVEKITLHVGIGTFRPVTVEDLSLHKMDSEVYEVSEQTAWRINETRNNGGRIVAVGTTVARTLESVADAAGRINPQHGEADLFIRPPYKFKAVDVLLTNFHLPGSTLLMMVSALASRDKILEAYRDAIIREYRFFSYGDAMLIL